MAYYVPTVTCTGVNKVDSAAYTLANGVLPGQVILRCNPQATAIPPDVQVTFNGRFGSIPLRRCVMDYGSIRRNGQNQIVSLRVWDRRKLWEWGEATGRYNVHQPNGSIKLSTQQSLRDLARILLDDASETGYDISLVPDNVYPEVELDCDAPMLALEKMLSQFGLLICWNPITDLVHVERDGYGSSLPFTADTSSLTFSVSQVVGPDKIAICAAQILFQAKFKLIAVGLETDNTVVPIDDLSYKPAGGWNYQEGTQWDDVRAQFGEREASLARLSVYKWYRIETFTDDTLDCPGYDENPISEIGDVLPLNGFLADTYAPAGSAYLRQKPAYVQGIHLPEDDDDAGGKNKIIANTAVTAVVAVPFELDRHNGIVKFYRHVVKRDANQFLEPELYLTASFYITDSLSLVKERYIRELDLGGVRGTGVGVEKREDIQRQILGVYAGDDPTATPTVSDNETTVEAEADLQLALLQAKWAPRTSKVVMFRDFQGIVTGGRVKQVTWTQDLQNGADTMAGEYCEFEPGVLREIEASRIRDWRRQTPEFDRARIQGRRVREEKR